MDNNKLLWLGLGGFVVVIIILAAGMVMYLDKSRQLTATQNQVQQLQADYASLKKQAEAKDKQIKDLEMSVNESKENNDQLSRANQELRQNIDTVGKCLTGVVGLMDAAGSDNYTQMATQLGALYDPCHKSDAILAKFKADTGNRSSL